MNVLAFPAIEAVKEQSVRSGHSFYAGHVSRISLTEASQHIPRKGSHVHANFILPYKIAFPLIASSAFTPQHSASSRLPRM